MGRQIQPDSLGVKAEGRQLRITHAVGQRRKANFPLNIAGNKSNENNVNRTQLIKKEKRKTKINHQGCSNAHAFIEQQCDYEGFSNILNGLSRNGNTKTVYCWMVNRR